MSFESLREKAAGSESQGEAKGSERESWQIRVFKLVRAISGIKTKTEICRNGLRSKRPGFQN